MRHVFMLRLGELIGGRDISDFARDVGFKTETIRRYTVGERIPKGDFLYSLCKATGVSSDWLLGLSDEKRLPVASSEPAPAAPDSGALHVSFPSSSPEGPRVRLLRLYDTDPAVRAHIDRLVELLDAHS